MLDEEMKNDDVTDVAVEPKVEETDATCQAPCEECSVTGHGVLMCQPTWFERQEFGSKVMNSLADGYWIAEQLRRLDAHTFLWAWACACRDVLRSDHP